MRYNEFSLLSVTVRHRFEKLRDILLDDHEGGRVECRFHPFETFRSPVRQLEVLRNGKSKAGPYESPHNFGLAVDFVPWVQGSGWTWDVSGHAWDHLRYRAHELGLRNDITWDRAHVQAPEWDDLWPILRRVLHGR